MRRGQVRTLTSRRATHDRSQKLRDPRRSHSGRCPVPRNSKRFWARTMSSRQTWSSIATLRISVAWRRARSNTKSWCASKTSAWLSGKNTSACQTTSLKKRLQQTKLRNLIRSCCWTFTISKLPRKKSTSLLSWSAANGFTNEFKTTKEKTRQLSLGQQLTSLIKTVRRELFRLTVSHLSRERTTMPRLNQWSNALTTHRLGLKWLTW